MGRHSVHRLQTFTMSVALSLVALMVAAGYLIVPGIWQWTRAQALVDAKKPHQIDTAEQPVDSALVERLKVTGDGSEFGPVILTYHDIGYASDSKYTVTPEEFAVQMRLLHDAGWTTLSSEEMGRWVNGGTIDRHSVMITFDDGAHGVWKYAEPIMARYNMRGVAFIITGSVGTHAPYYMTWDMLSDLERTGRWDFQAHTHDGHRQVQTDPQGGMTPFMTADEWLPAQQRYETPEERHARVVGDLVECKRQLKEHGLGVPIFFAYPFSAHEDSPGQVDIEVQQIVSSLYLAAMLDDVESTRVTGPADLAGGFIRRMDTIHGLTPDRFVQKIEEATTT